VPVDAELELELELELEPEAELLLDPPESPDDDGRLLLYPSLYQPPPLRWNAVADTRRSSTPPQASHCSLGGSEKRSMCSSSAPQRAHR
jgi:hypothetical protein